MKVFSLRYLVAFALLALCACNRDPNYVKQQYLQSGNKYFDRGRYKEALIMYRKALSKDQKFGEAYYRMALTALKMGQIASAAGPLRRAVELLPNGTYESDDSKVKLGEILLRVAEDVDAPGKNKPLVDEAEQMKQGMLSRNPNSFGGNKLAADILLVGASDAFRRGEQDKAKELVRQSSEQYRKTLAIKPDDDGTRMALARTLTMIQQYPEAEKLYRQAIAKTPSDATPYRELYQILMAEKRTADAEQLLKDAMNRNVTDQNFELMLAGHYFTQHDTPRMKSMLDKIESQIKDNPAAYFAVGDFYLRAGDSNEAIRQYQAGIQHDPAHKTEYEKRVIDVMIRQGKVSEAYEKNLDLLKESPKDPDARGIKASFMLDKGDVNQALTELQAVVTAKPENFVARFNLGRAHFAKGQYEQAMQQFTEAVKLRPDYLRPRLAMIQVALIQNNDDLAYRWAQEAEKFSPNNPSVRLMESVALMRMNRLAESRALLEALNKANPTQPDILLELGVLNLADHKYAEAATAFHNSFASDPSNIKGLLGETQAYYKSNQPQKALQAIQDAVNKYPDRGDIAREFAAAHMQLGEYDVALQELQELIAKHKLSPHEQSNALAAIGEIYSRKGDQQKAIEYLEKGRALNPDNVGLLDYLAQTYNRTGQREQARKLFQEALTKDPNNAATMNNLAFLMADLGTDLDQALTLANRAKQRLPNLVEISDTIGWIYLKKNLSDSATEVFKDLNAKVPNNATFRLHYCMALAQKGDKAAASRECHTAMDLKPSKEDQDQIKQVLSRLS